MTRSKRKSLKAEGLPSRRRSILSSAEKDGNGQSTGSAKGAKKDENRREKSRSRLQKCTS
ncbi:MAG: hypothetical protein L6V93_03990 [Clostridiales bacterium]|nr:MAG: hypothetical protein L6V93_03990 [Clostridiales bacterium]